MMQPSTTPGFARLLDWIEGHLPADEATQLSAWAAQADPNGQAQVVWLRAFVRQSEHTVLAPPSDTARQHVLQHFEAYAREHRKPGIIQHLAAMLISTSGSRPALAGTRGANTNTNTDMGRQLLYSTDLADVILNIRARPRDRHFDVSGQVLPLGDSLTSTLSPLTVQMLQNEAEYGITLTNQRGEFVFEAIPSGAYGLMVCDQQHEIEIAPIEL